MAKSFKDKIQQKAVNPTLQFISQPEEQTKPEIISQPEGLTEDDIRIIAKTIMASEGKIDGIASGTRRPMVIDLDGKQGSEVRPLSDRDIEGMRKQAKRKAPPARRALPQYEEETKSRRLQLLLTPSLYEAIKDKAAEERLSVNEFINSALKDAISRK